MLKISDHSGRVNALFPSDYAFRDIYLLASATEDEPDTDERVIHGNKELLLIPGAVHTDLYDRMDIIPFDRIEAFYRQYLK